MRAISPKLRKEMSDDPYYSKCCLSGTSYGKIDWHHNLIFAGRQVNEPWCILPLETNLHRDIIKYKEMCDWVMLNRATDEELKRYSKAENLTAKKDKLNKKYDIYKPERYILQEQD